VDPLLQQMIDAGLVDDRADVLAQQIRRGQGLMSTPGAQGMNVGGTYKAASPLEHAASAMARIMGGRMVKGAEADLAKGMETKRAGRAAFAEAGAPALAGALSGDPAMAAAGQASALEAYRGQQAGLDRQRLAQTAAQHQADAEARAAAQAAETEDRRARLALERERLGLDRSRADQDSWTAIADPVTGGIVQYNKKTGEVRSLGPGGGKPGPGTVPPKPKDLEDDVQALGKDVEALTTMGPDLETLRGAMTKGEAAGFGPVAGRVPDLLATKEAVANRQAAGRLMAAIIKETSGSAASEGEVQRLLEANGMGRTATPEQLKQGVAKLEGKIATLRKQREAKYHPQVLETYRTRGGHTSAEEPPVPGAVKTKSGRWAVQNAQGQLEYVGGQ
jgi:hypothetical protein